MSEVEEFNEEQFKEEVKKSLVEDQGSEEIAEEIGEEPEYSEIEQNAIAKGWRPEGVEGKKNLSAEEFLDRQKLYDEISHLKKNTKEMQKAFDALQKHHKRVAEAERKKVIEELKLQKRLALETDDFDRVMEIDDKLLEANKEPEEDVVQEQAATNNAAFESWSAENRWYMTDRDLRDWADIIGKRYFEENPGVQLEEVYGHVTTEIKKKFPEKFGITPRKSSTSAAVDSGARRTSKPTAASKKYSARDLPEDAFQMMKTILRTTNMTEEQYLKEYFESA